MLYSLIGFGICLNLGFFAYLLVSSANDDSRDFAGPASRAATPRRESVSLPPPTPLPTPDVSVDLPPEQLAFCNAIAAHARQYEKLRAEQANQLQLSNVRSSRRGAVLAAVPSGGFDNWFGVVQSLRTNSDGDAVLIVSLPCGARIQTFNNSASDIGNRTLITHGSALYQSIAALNEGIPVRIAGTFFPDSQDGYRELSLTEKGSLTSPEYLGRYLEVIPAGFDGAGNPRRTRPLRAHGRAGLITDYCDYANRIAVKMAEAHHAQNQQEVDRLLEELSSVAKDDSVSAIDKARLLECFKQAGVAMGAISP